MPLAGVAHSSRDEECPPLHAFLDRRAFANNQVCGRHCYVSLGIIGSLPGRHKPPYHGNVFNQIVDQPAWRTLCPAIKWFLPVSHKATDLCTSYMKDADRVESVSLNASVGKIRSVFLRGGLKVKLAADLIPVLGLLMSP